MTTPPPFIPYGSQWLDDEDVAAVTAALKGDYLTTGPKVAELERAFVDATGAQHAVAVNSGTAALHVAYHAAGLGPGDELITSPLTFAATSNAALYLGATVRFADVLPDTGNLDPEAVKPLITERTKIVTAVDFAGHPADYGALRPLTVEHGLTLVADAAHSLGAERHGRRAGCHADLTTFSTHPVKVVTTGEGGVVVTDRADYAQEMNRFRSHGLVRSSDPDLVHTSEGPWYMEQHALGFNYRLPDFCCALGISQMRKLERFVARRREVAARYDEGLADVEGLELPVVVGDAAPAWHLYPVRVRESSRRRAFFDALRERRIGAQVHYVPVYWHPFYSQLGFDRGMCPVAEDWYRREVSIPMYPRLTNTDVDDVISRVRDAARAVL